MGGSLGIEGHGDIAVLRLHHGKANALDIDLCRGLIGALDDVAKADARALVLTGTGRMFSAGVDLLQLQEGGAPYVTEFMPLLRQAFESLFSFSKPVVAALNGHAIAGGCVLACASDRRLMASGAGRIGVPELRVGLPFPTVALEAIRLAVAPSFLQSVVYDGQTYEPEEALGFGLVDEIVTPEALLDEALRAARAMAAAPPAAFAFTKHQLRASGLARIADARNGLERRIEEDWCDQATLERVREYVAATLRRG
jgi:enoyl-CoA hydratase